MSPSLLAGKKTAIIGLGQMGGSLALALHDHCGSISAVDNDPETIAFARQAGFVDRISSQPQEILPGADVIILATPVRSILALLPQLGGWMPGEALVIDLGSTKAEICKKMEVLPPRLHAIGGHPMCGTEHSSIRRANAALFSGAPFALCTLASATPQDHQLCEALVKAIGARPVWLDAGTHDRWVAATSHVPYLMANTLAAALPANARPLIGPGLRSSSRLAASNIQMMIDILLTNREAVLAHLRNCQSQLSRLQELIESQDEEALAQILQRGRNQYLQWIVPQETA